MRAASVGLLLLAGFVVAGPVACDDVHNPAEGALGADDSGELGETVGADVRLDVGPDTLPDAGTFDASTGDTAQDGGPSDVSTEVPTRYERDLQPLLDGCKGCHSGGLIEFELDLTDPWQSVGVASKQAPLDLIVAGSHLDSYLWHKVNGSQGIAGGAGGQMPLGLPWTSADIQTLADWIDAGLPR